jgi:hypothetical protein
MLLLVVFIHLCQSRNLVVFSNVNVKIKKNDIRFRQKQQDSSPMWYYLSALVIFMAVVVHGQVVMVVGFKLLLTAQTILRESYPASLLNVSSFTQKPVCTRCNA